MKHRDITVPDPEYKRFASAIQAVRQRADSRTTHPVARVRANVVTARSEREVFFESRHRGVAGSTFRRHGRRSRSLQQVLATVLQIPIILIYHPLPTQPNWPRRVRLSLQSRHRPGTRRSGHRVRFRTGDGSIRFVRGAGRRPTRRGSRMRYVPGIRPGSRRAGGDTTEHGRAARLRCGFIRTRSPAGRAVQPLVPARCSSQR